jgi:FkbM family methyltransferase
MGVVGGRLSDNEWARSRWKRYADHCLAALDPFRRQRIAAGAQFALSNLVAYRRAENQATIRSLCRSVYLGDDMALSFVLGRYKMYVDSTDVGLSGHLLLDGYWEMWVTEAMARLIKPGMVVADIGANPGYYTVLMGELVGSTGWVHAFEPNPPIVERLRRNVSINGGYRRTTIHQIALGERNGEAEMFVPVSEPKNARIVTGPRDGSIAVPICRLDSLEGLDRLDVIKVDVEGAEEGLWRGMDGILNANRSLTIFLEFTADRYADAGRFVDDILARNFSLSLIGHDGRIVALDKTRLLALPRNQDQMLLLER